MTPSNQALKMNRGARLALRFSCFAADSETPLDLSGLGPFVMEIRRRSRAPLLLSPTFVEVDMTQGIFEFISEAEDTSILPVCQARYGIRDALDNLYADGIMDILPATPNPDLT
jgi:hypothetical protein